MESWSPSLQGFSRACFRRFSSARVDMTIVLPAPRPMDGIDTDLPSSSHCRTRVTMYSWLRVSSTSVPSGR
jgi:hypothetical protein